jgi:putative glutamine amidotransferase
MRRPPRVAVLLDENTSSGGTRYEAAKGYFQSVSRAGGAPFGVPYDPAMVELVVADFDALLTPGGRYAMPADWYAGEAAPSPRSDRLQVEIGLLRGFLAADKPVLGLCAGMQVLAALHGAKLTAQVPDHNERGRLHDVRVAPGSRLAGLVGERLSVNTFHNEAVVEPGAATACAWSDDGVIEGVELPRHRFAIGVQWHQELHDADHPGAALFQGLVDACGRER